MARRRRLSALFVLGTMTVFTVAALSAPAGAIVTDGCTGSATFSNGTIVNAGQSLSIVSVIPTEDTTVGYVGAIDIPRPPPDEPIPFVGGVGASIAGIGSWTVVPWSGDTIEIDAKGSYMYDIPTWVPRGTGTINVIASHTQGGKTCMAQVNVTLDGNPGAAAVIGATGTALFFAGTLAAGMKKKGVA